MATDPRMIANNLESYRPVHPGELLKDEIEYRSISQKELAKQLDLPCTELDEILDCKRPVTTDFALLVEAALGVNPGILLRMQTNYNLQMAKKDKKILLHISKIRKIAAML